MAPSPSLRRSPGKELKKGNSHKRGQSLESGLPVKTKDDELMLFNEVQKHETVNFLSHISDDFDDSLDFKLGITIPVQGGSSDLLDIGCDKNDYEWLLTPPDTPLFPSLDDDEPQPTNTSRGRTRSQPVPISRSYMNEKTHRTSRSSASPHRLSLSPQSCHGVTQTMFGLSSAHRSKSPPTMQQRSTLQSSSAPTKPSASTPRSSIPTSQRTNYGTNGQASSPSRRGTSPVNANRGYSTSPKLRGWQPDLPGFPTEAPSNLQTFLPDRSASHVRGSSSTSRSSICSSSKNARRSMSPSNSRSASSSQGHERHQFTSCRRSSLASSYDDSVDSVQSITGGISENSSVRKYPASMNNRAMISYKRTPSFPSASTGPRRSFDSLEHQKAPRNMFRPLLSSVSSSNKLYVGKTNSEHGSMFSRSLSRTTSNNTRFESGFNCVLDTRKSDLGRYDLTGELEKKKTSETQGELLIFDKFDEVSDDNHCDTFSGKLQSINKDFAEDSVNIVDVRELGSAAFTISDAKITAPDPQSLHITECSGIKHNEMVFTCLRCGKHVLIIDLDEYMDVCGECAAADKLLDSGEQGVRTNKTTNGTGSGSVDPLDSSVHFQTEAAVHPGKTSNKLMLGYDGSSSEMEVASLSDNCPSLLGTIVGHKDFSEVVTDNLDMNDQQLHEQLKGSLDEVGAPGATSGYSFQGTNLTIDSSLTFGTPRGTGLPLQLMRRSSSLKWPIMRGRTLSATSIVCSEPSYARENFSVMKCSIDRDSSSASSSIDLGSSGRTNVASRKTDVCVLRRFNSKDIVDNARSTSYVNSESIDSHSEASVIVTEALTYPSSEYEEDFCGTVKSGYKEDTQETHLVNMKHWNADGDNNLRFAENIFIETAFVCPSTSMASDASCIQVSYPEPGFQLHDEPGRDCLNNDDNLSTNGSEALLQNARMRIQEVELDGPVATLDSCSIVDNLMLNDEQCQDDVSGLANYRSSNLALKKQTDNCFQDKQNEQTHSKMPDNRNDSQEGCFLTMSNEDLSFPASEPNCVEHSSSATRSTQKTFNWEDATDTVLFCSSIVHDLAHKAATTGMEKDMTLLETYCPTVTHSATPGSYGKDFHIISNKSIQNLQKVKRRIPEIDPNKPLMGMSNEVGNREIASSNAEVTQTPNNRKPPPVKLGTKCSCAVM